MRLPIIHLTEGNVVCRVPATLVGKRFSCVSVGMCNFKCGYCYLGGMLERIGNRFPNTEMVDLEDIYEFIRIQVHKGNPIKISGGEPTMFFPITIKLIEYIKKLGGYVAVDTSAWNPELSLKLARVIDQIAIDIKGPPTYATKVTKADIKLSWDNSILSIKTVAEIVPTLEVRTPVFGFTTFDDMGLIAKQLPEEAFWIVRRFITDWVPFDKFAQSRHPGNSQPILKYEKWLTSPSREYMHEIGEWLLYKFPHLVNRLIILCESPRDSGGKSPMS